MGETGGPLFTALPFRSKIRENFFRFYGYCGRRCPILSLEVIVMSPKELLYIEDALGHEKFLKTQCEEAVQNLQDGELKTYCQQLMDKHQQIFNQFYSLV